MKAIRKIGVVSVFAWLAFEGVASGAAISWTGGGADSNWSNTNNWNLLRAATAGDAVTFATTTRMPPVVNQNVTVDTITFNFVASMAPSLQVTGGSKLTVSSIVKLGSVAGSIEVPLVVPAGGLILSAGNGNTWNINGQISGSDPLTLMGGAQLTMKTANPSFSGSVLISNVYCRISATNCLGTGSITLGSGSSLAALWPDASLIFGSAAQTITVGAGTGARQITTQTSGLTVTMAHQWILNTNLSLMMNSLAATPSRVTFGGNMSGAGGLLVVGSSNDTYVLSGSNSYQGATLCATGTVVLNGSLGNGKVVIGTGAARAKLEGVGSIALNDNERILVGTNGTLNIGGLDGLRFDLTKLTGKNNILATYTNGTLLDPPANLQDMMTYSSSNSGMILEVADYQIRTKAGTPTLTPPILATNTWTGLAGGGNWSVPGNWSLGVVPNLNHVVVVGVPTTVDVSVAISALSLTNGFTLASSGGAGLTIYRSINRTFKDNAQVVNVPITLGADVTITAAVTSSRELVFNSAISGSSRILAKTLGAQLQFSASNPSFSGELAIYNSVVRFNNGALGTGPVTMGSGDGSGAATLFYHSTGAYTLTTNTVTVQPGTGARTIISQGTTSTTLPLKFILNKDLVIFSLPAGGQCTLSGAISGSAGMIMESASATGVLSGVCSYLGSTSIRQGTLSLNGLLTNANIVVGHTSVTARVNGSGTVWFRDGNVIDVNTNGTLDATALRFDLSLLSGNPPYVLVDYSHQGTFIGPSTLRNVLAPASRSRFDVMDNTSAKQIVAVRAAGTLILVR